MKKIIIASVACLIVECTVAQNCALIIIVKDALTGNVISGADVVENAGTTKATSANGAALFTNRECKTYNYLIKKPYYQRMAVSCTASTDTAVLTVSMPNVNGLKTDVFEKLMALDKNSSEVSMRKIMQQAQQVVKIFDENGQQDEKDAFLKEIRVKSALTKANVNDAFFEKIRKDVSNM